MALSQMRVRFAIVVLALSLSLAGGPYAGTAHACSCAGGSDASAAYEGADAVFAGEMVRGGLEDPDPADGMMIGGVEFRVIDAWKGVSGDSAVLYGQEMVYYGEIEEGGMVTSSSCAYIFVKGGRYLVYADRYEDGFQTLLCDGTKRLKDAGKDLEALDSPLAVLPETGGVPPGGNERQAVHALAAAAVLASLAAGVVLGGRFARRPWG